MYGTYVNFRKRETPLPVKCTSALRVRYLCGSGGNGYVLLFVLFFFYFYDFLRSYRRLRRRSFLLSSRGGGRVWYTSPVRTYIHYNTHALVKDAYPRGKSEKVLSRDRLRADRRRSYNRPRRPVDVIYARVTMVCASACDVRARKRLK